MELPTRPSRAERREQQALDVEDSQTALRESISETQRCVDQSDLMIKRHRQECVDDDAATAPGGSRVERESNAEKTYDEPSAVSAENGKVLVDGPDSVEVALTPDAAVETSERLLVAGIEARGQQMKQQRESGAVDKSQQNDT